MADPTPTVRVATPADRTAVVETIVAAFRTDPAWGFFLGPRYELLAPLFAGALFDKRVGRGTVWMTPDAGSVALWDGPGGPDPAHVASAWAPFDAVAGPAEQDRVAAYDAAVEQAHPDGPFWYLGVLATRPDAQGRGGATAVLQPGLTAADTVGLPACLETSTADNREFYARRGFTDVTQVDCPGGPPTWWLTRPVS